MIYEYHAIRVNPTNPDALEKRLNEWGAKGWRVVNVLSGTVILERKMLS